MSTKAKTATVKSVTKAIKAGAKAPAKKTVAQHAAEAVERNEEFKLANATASPRTTAIHLMWEILQAGSVTTEQLNLQVAKRLIASHKMDAAAAAKLASQAIDHQLPIETGQKGRKSVRVRQIKGGKLEWVGGAIRRRQIA
ncbi:MAG: hypothetical protein AB7G28_07880 [Pirellulales bacterium]